MKLVTSYASILIILASVGMAAIVGEDDEGRIISNDANTLEARFAEAFGRSSACGEFAGQLSLIKYEDSFFLLGAAHAFYAEGQLKCDEDHGYFLPDFHYKGSNSVSFDNKRSYEFVLPPVNHEITLKDGFDRIRPDSVTDFVILEISDPDLLESQRGTTRTYFELLDISVGELPSFSENNNVVIAGIRSNFMDNRRVPINENCSIDSLIGRAVEILRVLKHDCDTGDGTSGASLMVFDEVRPLSLGVHIHGDRTSDEEYASTNKGNYFIPSEVILGILQQTDIMQRLTD